MKWLGASEIRLVLIAFVAAFVAGSGTVNAATDNHTPIGDAGSSRYAAHDPVVLDGTGSYDPDNSGPLSYAWRQIAGPPVVIIDANTAIPTVGGSMLPGTGRDPVPTVGGFTQTNEIQECEFELVVSDGELASLPDTVKVIIVPDFGYSTLRQENPPFDPDKPTVIYFGGGDCRIGWSGQGWNASAWNIRANVISFPNGYGPDSGGATRTYYKYGDMIIVYLSAVAPDYRKPIQTIGWSTGGQPAIDVGIRLNSLYQDARYAVNRVTQMDAPCRVDPQWGGSWELYTQIAESFLSSSVDGEQCWLDFYYGTGGLKYEPLQFQYLLTAYLGLGHDPVRNWYRNSLTGNDMNNFNSGVVAGAYWSVVGPGKNLQLAPQTDAYYFRWYGGEQSGSMSLYDETQYPGKLPEPVTLVGPEDGAFVDANGAVFSCEQSENAVGYQLLFSPDPHRVMDYYIVSDTPNPPTEVITASPFGQTWWTVKVYDQYGTTIYADPIRINFENLAPPLIENITTGQRYASVRHAIDDARNGHEIIVSPGVYRGNISFIGKNLTLRSIDPNDPAVVVATVIKGGGQGPAVTFAGGEDANCVLAGFTITSGTTGIYCSGASPTITNCTIVGNVNADMGAGMYLKDGSSPTLVNCMFSENSASMLGGGMYNENSSPILMNCTFSGNWADYFVGEIYCAGGSPTLTNCILWGHTSEEIFMFGATPVITYSDVKGGWPGEGNIDTDPLFADPNNGDYHLKSQSGRWDQNSQSWVKDDVTSPCIDAGDPNSYWQEELWPHGKGINMGAYGGTTQASMSLSTIGNIADLNNDNTVGHADLMMLVEKWLHQKVLLAEDLDRNGVVNLIDFCILTDEWLWHP